MLKLIYNTSMIDQGESKMSWLGSKYLLSNPKKEKNDLLNCYILRSYSKTFMGKEIQEKVYYDTPELFFHKNGIHIGTSAYKGQKEYSLIVRYDSEKERISYLSYMPDTFEMKIDSSSPIKNHLAFIARAISNMITNGLEVDILETLQGIKPVMVVKKKRECYRINGMNALRMFFYFDECEYTTPLAKGKEKMNLLEIVCENDQKEFKDLFEKTTKDLIIANPTIIETSHSDLLIGLDSLVYFNKI